MHAFDFMKVLVIHVKSYHVLRGVHDFILKLQKKIQ